MTVQLQYLRIILNLYYQKSENKSHFEQMIMFRTAQKGVAIILQMFSTNLNAALNSHQT